MSKTIVLVGYARSGVTVLNRCLSGDSRLICLSEINSRFVCPTQPNSPHEQLSRWYGIHIEKGSIMSELKDTSESARNLGKTFILRDWSFGSFVPLKYNDFTPPGFLNTVDDLKATLPGEVSTFAFVRNPVDVWLSMKDSTKSFHDINLAYLKEFVFDVKKRNIPILKYEAFCEDQQAVLSEIYSMVGQFPPPTPSLSRNVIGDLNYPATSRGADKDIVCKLPRRMLLPEDISFLKSETHAREILNILGYTDQSLLN